VPVNPAYILYHDAEKVVIRNYEGKIFEYPEAGAPAKPSAPRAPKVDLDYLYS
jgi:hypothetical protein